MINFAKDFESAEVMHKTFGLGKIKSFDIQSDSSSIMNVEFNKDLIKKFSFPSCFIENYLNFTNITFELKFAEYYLNKIKNKPISKNEMVLSKISGLDLNKDIAINTILSMYEDKDALEILKKKTIDLVIEYDRTRIISNEGKNIVLFTLAWISFDNYDGRFWEFVRNELNYLYRRKNQQDTEKAIREIISEQEKYADSRHITNAIVHAGIPEKYLKKFYDFVYDIYKINFDCQIVNQPVEEILLDSLEGLVPILNQVDIDDDKLELNVTHKTYTLIKSTKLALIHYKTSIIHLLKTMLEIINDWYYGINSDNSYLKKLIEKRNEWLDEVRPIRPSIDGKEYIAKPEYSFVKESKEIKILFPQYSLKRVEEEGLDSINVELTYDNNKKILEKTQFKIIKKIGYNSLQIMPLELDIISSNINVKIFKGENAIISTNDSLNRNFIIFDGEGKERGNYKEYEGLVYVAFPKNISFSGPDNPKIINSNPRFDIAVFIANQNSTYICGEETIHFSSMLKPGLYGEEINNIDAHVGDRKIAVFTKVRNFVFEAIDNIDDLNVRVNNKSCELNSLPVKITKRGNFWNYNVTLREKDLSSNLNIIRISSKTNRFYTKTEEFLLDKNLEFVMLETEKELEKVVILTSSFPLANIKETRYNFAKNTYYKCEFRLGKTQLKYVIDPIIKRYKWDLEDDWKMLEDLELKNREVLYLSSLQNVIHISNMQGNDILWDIPSNNDNGFSSIEMVYISQLKKENDYVFLTIKDCLNKEEYKFKMYLKQFIMSHNIIKKNDENFMIKFDIKNFSENTLQVILKKEGAIVFNEMLLKDEIELEKVEPYTKYAMEVVEKGNIFLGMSRKVIYEKSIYITDATKLVGKKYKINKIFIYRYDANNDLIYEPKDIKPIVIEIKNKLVKKPNECSNFNIKSNMTYRCNLYKLDQFNQLIPFKQLLREVFIEVTDGKNSAIINISVEDIDGDGLMLSKNQRFLVDSADEEGSYSIDFLVIDTENGDIYD